MADKLLSLFSAESKLEIIFMNYNLRVQ